MYHIGWSFLLNDVNERNFFLLFVQRGTTFVTCLPLWRITIFSKVSILKEKKFAPRGANSFL